MTVGVSFPNDGACSALASSNSLSTIQTDSDASAVAVDSPETVRSSAVGTGTGVTVDVGLSVAVIEHPASTTASARSVNLYTVPSRERPVKRIGLR